MRLYYVNPRWFSLDKQEKIESMIAAAKQYKLDSILLSSPDRKWTLKNIDKVKQKF